MFNSKLGSSGFDDGVFNTPENQRLFIKHPKILIGFDTETTGFKDPEPLTYGFAVYKDGKLHSRHHFVAKPMGGADYEPYPEETAGAGHNHVSGFGNGRYVEKGASEVNHWTANGLNHSYFGGLIPIKYRPTDEELFKDPQFTSLDPETTKNFNIADIARHYLHPALHPKVAVNKATDLLARYINHGAKVVTANGGYDFHALKNTWEKYNNADFSTSGLHHFDIHKVGKDSKADGPHIDVIAHDWAIDPALKGQSKHPDYRSRSLTNLCKHYGVEPGNHVADDDARAAVDVFLKQIEHNNNRLGNVRTSASLTNPNEFMPCTGKPNCRSCMHFDELIAQHSQTAEGEQLPPRSIDNIKKLKQMKKQHVKIRKSVL